jgi:hypothetical protein
MLWITRTIICQKSLGKDWGGGGRFTIPKLLLKMLLCVTGSQTTASSLNEHDDSVESKYTSHYGVTRAFEPRIGNPRGNINKEYKWRNRHLQSLYRYE